MHIIRIPRAVKLLGLMAFGILVIAMGLLPIKGKAANEFLYSIDVRYNVPAAGPTNVVQTYDITNNTSNKYLDSIKISAPSGDVKNLKIYYRGGGSIPFTTQVLVEETGGFKFDYTQINIDFPTAEVGQGLKWGFIVDYQTNSLVENKGRANIVYIPGIAQENRDYYTVRLVVPTSFGEVHGFGSIPHEESRQGGEVTYKFDDKVLIGNSVQLLFGNSTTYKAGFVFPLENKSSLSKSFDISLPPNTPSQSVFIQSLEPKPDSTSLDADGNVIARYKLGANQKVNVKADILADVKYLKYDLSKSGTTKDIPNNLKATYTKPTKYWQSDNPDIVAKSKELTNGKATVADQVSAINKYVIDTLEYNNEKIKYNIRQGSLKALQNPANVVCLEYSDLTIALLRAAGIPARMPVGYGYSGDLKLSTSVSDSLHSWVETYVPNVGWINLDPTWGEKFNNLGISDLDHLTFAIWGASDSTPVAVSAGGQDTNYQYEQATLSYVQQIPTPSKDAALSVNRWVILPFITLIQYQAKGPSNSATQNISLAIDSNNKTYKKPLGSIAPSQKVAGLFFSLGLGYGDKSLASLTDQASLVPLATAKVSNNYMPMLFIIILLSIIIIWVVVKLLHKRDEKNPIKKDQQNDQQRIQK